MPDGALSRTTDASPSRVVAFVGSPMNVNMLNARKATTSITTTAATGKTQEVLRPAGSVRAMLVKKETGSATVATNRLKPDRRRVL